MSHKSRPISTKIQKNASNSLVAMSFDNETAQQIRHKSKGRQQKKNHGIQATHVIIATIALAMTLMLAGNFRTIQNFIWTIQINVRNFTTLVTLSGEGNAVVVYK